MFEFKVEKQLVAHIIKNEKNNNNKYFNFDIIAEERTLNTKLGEKRFDLIGMDDKCFYFIEVKPKITDDKKFNGEFKRVVRLMKSFKSFKEIKYLFVASEIDINAKKKIDRYNQIDYVEIKDAIHNKKLPTPPTGKEKLLDPKCNIELLSALRLSRFTTKYYKCLNGNKIIGDCNIIRFCFDNNLGINIKYERTHRSKYSIMCICYEVTHYNKLSIYEDYYEVYKRYTQIPSITLFEIANYIKSIPSSRIIYPGISGNNFNDIESKLKKCEETYVTLIGRKFYEDIYAIYN